MGNATEDIDPLLFIQHQVQDQSSSVSSLKERSEAGDSDAMYQYSVLCLAGGIKGEAEAGLGLLEESASKGQGAAQTLLGQMLLIGEGLEQDALNGVEWLKKAREQDVGEASESPSPRHFHRNIVG